MAAETLPVIFRKWDDGEVVALFPTVPFDLDRSCASYMHVGQHGAANYHFVIGSTRPAKPEEYMPLFQELQVVGYEGLKVYQRATRKMHDERNIRALVE